MFIESNWEIQGVEQSKNKDKKMNFEEQTIPLNLLSQKIKDQDNKKDQEYFKTTKESTVNEWNDGKGERSVK